MRPAQSIPAQIPRPAPELVPEAPFDTRRTARRLALLGGGVALGVALVARGRLHPDEIFQYLEPAHRVVFGFGEVAWEWRDGVRNWVAPGLIAALLLPFRALHLDDPRAMIVAVWAAAAAAHAGGVLALFRLVQRRDGPHAARLAAFVHATWGAYALYAARPLADSLCVPPLLAALSWTLRARDRGRLRDGAWAGIFAGLAVVARYPSLVFGLPLGLSLLAARRWRALAGTALGTAAVLVALGLLDRVTWGSFLHSLRAYLAFNRPGGPVDTVFGVRPWSWYLGPLAAMAPLLLSFHLLRGLRRLDVVTGFFLLYAVVLLAHPHKEERFLVPLIPLWIAVAAGPAARDLIRWRAAHPRLGAALITIYLLSSLASATIQKPLGLRRGVIDAEIACGKDPTLTGLLVAGEKGYDTGGRFYLHRTVRQVAQEVFTDGELAQLLQQRELSHVLVSGKSVAESRLRAAGFVPWIRRDDVVVWRRSGPG